jgi:hypothetical protein
MDQIFKDFELVDKTDLSAEMKSAARQAVSTLQLLKALSSRLNVPIDEITAKDIVQEFSRWKSKSREYEEKFGYWFGDESKKLGVKV